MNARINKAMVKVTDALASLPAVIIALLSIVAWFFSRSLFSDDSVWMLIINTGTTIVTFVVGFVILYTSKSQARATEVKLDALLLDVAELREALEVASDRGRRVVGIDDKPDREIRKEQDALRSEAPD